MKVGRIIMIVVGALLALIGFGLLAGRRPDCSPMGRNAPMASSGPERSVWRQRRHAITSDRVDLESDPATLTGSSTGGRSVRSG